MTHRFVPRAPRRRHLWLPAGVGHRLTGRAYGPPPQGGFTPADLSGWQLGFLGSSGAAFGGSFPSNGASITALTALYGAGYTLGQDAANPVPTFEADGLGTGKHGVKFTRASAQCLVGSAGVGTDWWDTNPSATLFMVVRFPTGSVALGTQWLAGLCGPSATNSAHHQFAVIGQTTNMIYRCSGAQSASIDITAGSAIPEGQNVLIMIRRRETNATGQRLYGVRDGTTDAPPATGGVDTITTPLTVANMQFTVGLRKWTNTGVATRDLPAEYSLGALLLMPGEMTQTNEDSVRTFLKAEFAIP